MANTIYPKAKERALGAGLNLAAGTVKAQLLDLASYTYSASHQYLSDIPGGARVGAAVTLTGVTITNGVFDAADLIYSGLIGAPTIEGLAYYVEGASEATSPLVYFVDTSPDLPIAAGATGGTVTHDNGPNKIFALN